MKVYLQALLVACLVAVTVGVHYEPTWDSLDARPLPAWYDESKIGIFIHWGVFSVPSFGTEWFWKRWSEGNPDFVNFMKKNYPPNWTYADFAAQFTAEFFDPDYWADVFEASGAKYIVLTSKHHEGFCNWPTNVSYNWNSMQVGPKRDLVGSLAEAIKKKPDIHFGLYHSLYEWFNPLFLKDSDNKYSTRYFPQEKTIPELYELVNTYEPEVVWSDGAGAPEDYWGSKEFLAWLYNDSPVKDTVVTNDRWADSTSCKHGGYYTCHDRYNPGVLQKHKWENCMTIDKRSWGYRREAVLADFLTIHDLITTLAETVSCGGNLLVNVGPTHEGLIEPIFEERLRQLGDWLKINGEAIYKSVPWKAQKDAANKNVWYTAQKQANNSTMIAYAIVLEWPENNILELGSPSSSNSAAYISMLGVDGPLKWGKSEKGDSIDIQLPVLTEIAIPSQTAWVLKMAGF